MSERFNDLQHVIEISSIVHNFTIELNAIEKEYIDVKYTMTLHQVSLLHPTIRVRLYAILEYYAWLINDDRFDSNTWKRAKEFMIPTILDYFKRIFLKHYKEDVDKENQETKYQELEKLYNKYNPNNEMIHEVTITGQKTEDGKEGDGTDQKLSSISHLHNIES